MSHFIYALCEPNSGEIRYIGQSNDPFERLIEHLSAAWSDPVASRAKAAWLRSLNSPPTVRILEQVAEGDDSLWRERYWILLLRKRGAALLNAHFAGDESAPRRRRQPQLSSFGERVQTMRQAAGLSARALSRLIGASPSLIWHIETGRVLSPSLQTAVAIAKVFNAEVSDLLSGPTVRPLQLSTDHPSP